MKNHNERRINIKKIFKIIKEHKNIFFLIIFLLICVCTPIIIYFIYRNLLYSNSWSIGEILAYCGTVISSLGTIVLGYIAVKQNNVLIKMDTHSSDINDRLLEIEERSFIAQNTISAFVDLIYFKKIQNNIIDVNQHDEQILCSDKTKNNYSFCQSLTLVFNLKPHKLGNDASFVYINSLDFYIGDENFAYLKAHNPFKYEYSRVAVGKNKDTFEVSILVTSDEKSQILNYLQDYNSIIKLSLHYYLMNDNYVSSEYKCNAEFKSSLKNSSQNIYNNFKANNPYCLFYGASKHSFKDFKIRQINSK